MKPSPTIITKIGEADNGQDAVDVTVLDSAGKSVAHLTLSGDLEALAAIGKEIAGRLLPKDAAKS